MADFLMCHRNIGIDDISVNLQILVAVASPFKIFLPFYKTVAALSQRHITEIIRAGVIIHGNRIHGWIKRFF